MLGTMVTGMLIVCSLILLTGWAVDAIKAALEPKRGVQYSDGSIVGRGPGKSRTPITSLYRGGPVTRSHEPAIGAAATAKA